MRCGSADGSQQANRAVRSAQNNFYPPPDLGSRLYRAGAGPRAHSKPSIDRLGLNALVPAVFAI